MKILILANSSVGLYSFRNEIVLRLLKEHELVVSLPDDTHVNALREEGCKVVHTQINRRGMNPLEDIKTYFEYRRLLREEQPDLVLTYTIKPNIYGGYACRRMHIPYITTITGLGSSFQNDGFVKKMIVMMYRVSVKSAKCIFFQNNENRSIFEQNRIFGENAVTVMGSGVNLTKHTYVDYPKDDEIRLLFIGRIMKEKGIEELLECAKELHQERVKFEILGDCDEDYSDILDEYEKKGYIVQYGFQSDVKPYLEHCSAVILPTYHEGMSNVLMEASATGRPVLASRISGCAEIFEEGITGFGFEPKNGDSLKCAIERFLELSMEQRREMGVQARKKMEREFDRKIVTDEYMKIINQCFE